MTNNRSNVAIESASVREQPFYDSKVVKTIPKGTTVFVISKTETNDWYLIKEIKDNGLFKKEPKLSFINYTEKIIEL